MMYRFSRILFNRPRYSSFSAAFLSRRQEQGSKTSDSSLPLALLLTTSSLSLYEIYKRYRLCAQSPDESIPSTPKGPLIVDGTKPLKQKVPYSKQYNFIADVVEHVTPAVVHIEVDLAEGSYLGSFGTVYGTSNGSGFIVNENGLILTNAHVVRNRSRVRIKLADGQRFTGTVLAADMVADLAVIQIDANKLKLPYLNLGDSDRIRAGEHCIAVGSPLSLSNTVTAGIISNVGRASSELGLFGRDIHYIQTDCMITSGNSGGPLVNLDGEVVGVNSMKAVPGISFSLPINYAKQFLADTERKRSGQSTSKPSTSTPRRQTRYLGIKMFSLTPEIIDALRSRVFLPYSISKGVFVADVIPRSSAERVGLRPGDIIIQVNDRDLESSADLMKYVQESEVLNLTVIRPNGVVYKISVTPESID